MVEFSQSEDNRANSLDFQKEPPFAFVIQLYENYYYMSALKEVPYEYFCYEHSLFIFRFSCCMGHKNGLEICEHKAFNLIQAQPQIKARLCEVSVKQ